MSGTLGGVVFTVSLSVTGLAFDSPRLVADAKIGILVASVLAGALGTALLLGLRPRRTEVAGQVQAPDGTGGSARGS